MENIEKKMLFSVLVVLFFLSAFFVIAEGQEEESEDVFPSEPIHFVVPAGAGGGTDTHARLIAHKMEEYLSVPVIIENVSGGGTAVGSRKVIESEPDGYTILLNIVNIFTNKALGNTEFDGFDFEPIAEVGAFYLCEVTGGDSEYTDFRQIMESIREEPGSVKIATRIGAITHFTSLGVQREVGGEFHMVHIGDAATRITNILGGHVDLGIFGTNEAVEYHHSGMMRILTVYSPERIVSLEDVPTAHELGLDYEQGVGFWIFAPPNTPENRIKILADTFEKVMNDPEIIEKLKSQTLVPTFKRGEEFITTLQKQSELIYSIAEEYDL